MEKNRKVVEFLKVNENKLLIVCLLTLLLYAIVGLFIKNGVVFVYGMHISPYEMGNRFNVDPVRNRKLLLNRREIDKLTGQVMQKAISLVPISIYFKGNKVKLEIGIGKGKKLYDKREDLAKKDAEMKIKRALKNNP